MRSAERKDSEVVDKIMPDDMRISGGTFEKAWSTHRWRLAGLVFAVCMIAVHVMAGSRLSGMTDFWRDFYWATSIAHGERYPWVGPPIYGMLELGPWWFYIVSVPVMLGGGAAAASAFVQGLAASKYLLAWWLGIRLRDARLGFAMVMALAIPGWSLLPLMFPTHTAVVEASMLALSVVTHAAWSRMTWQSGVLFGLAAAACVHAHPTTIALVGIAGLALLWRHRDRRALVAMVLALSIVLLSVSPPLFAPEHGVGMKEISTYLDSDIMVDPLRRAPALLRSIASGGAWWGFLLMTPWSEPVALRAFIASCILGMFAVAGVGRLYRNDRTAMCLAVLAATLLVAQVCFLVVVRPITPIWMVPSCLPPFAVLIGLGWYGWLTSTRGFMKAGTIGAIVLSTVLALVPFSIEFRELRTVRVMPAINPFIDVIETSDRFVKVDVPWYPLNRVDRLSATLCEPAVLHGRLGSIMEAAFASPVRNACGAWPSLRFGGVEGPPSHVLGLLPQQADSLGIAPDRVVAGMALYSNVRAIAPAQGGRLSPLQRAQVAPAASASPAKTWIWTFDATGGAAVVLTNRMPSAAPMRVASVTADGLVLSANGSDGSSFGYRCEACAGRARVAWRIEVDAVADNLDLVVVAADEGPAPQ